MEIQNWNGYSIRFIHHDGEWMALGKDVTDALGYVNSRDAIRAHVDLEDKNTVGIHDGIRGNPRRVVINENGIIDLIYNSRLPQAKQFKHWVHSIIKNLRESLGLSQFEAFKLTDIALQKQAMDKISGLNSSDKKYYIKANTIANKAVSNLHGYPKMISKGEMTPDMLADREGILIDVVDLMGLNERYNLGIHISKAIYDGSYQKSTLPTKKGVRS